MLSEFISITNLQRQLKKVFGSKKPIHIVLSRNTVSGLVFSGEATALMMESGMLDHLREELWELNDPETRDLVQRARENKTQPVPFNDFAKEHGL